MRQWIFEAREIMRTSLLSAKNLSFVVLALAIAVSGYLSYLKISNTQAVCVSGGAFDCGVVLNSAYSELGGIPIAYLGLATNLIVVALLLLERRLDDTALLLNFGVVLFAFLFSVYLVYVQAFVILAYCPWCLTHEALITVLFFLMGYRVWRWFRTPELQAQQVGD